MKVGNTIVYWMSRGNDNIRLWIDARVGRWWYVFYWQKGVPPSFYRSRDATPPRKGEDGRVYF
jgi:hypothetical protein